MYKQNDPPYDDKQPVYENDEEAKRKFEQWKRG